MNDKYQESQNIVDDLNSLKSNVQKEAVKKVISAMTLGKDVSRLFPHVIKCIETSDHELKKLVYLYIINYARYKPIETVLCVNSFKKDASDRNNNPLMRALAVRTMGCLGVEQILSYLADSVKEALTDKDPYMRKTAALCVIKIYDINAELAENDFGFVEMLQDIVENDGNSMVIANAVMALLEISKTSGKDRLNLDYNKVGQLIRALTESNEWAQNFLLEGIASYSTDDNDEINFIMNEVGAYLSHHNSGVILLTIRIIVQLMEKTTEADTVLIFSRKITAALTSLLAKEPEIQYIALKNMNYVIQKHPTIFEKNIKLFFCNFSEPIYNKLEKLEIISKLVNLSNVDLVLFELKDYATEVDVQFVRRVVRLVGECAIKLEKAAQRCVETLVDLVVTQIPFVIQEAIIALREIFRRYPNSFEGAMQIVNENLTVLTDSDSKAALIWIIGEYSDRIDGAEQQLSKFIDNLVDEPYQVQMALLTAGIKTYLKCQT